MARWGRGRSALVLLYHRVTHLASDRWSIAVPPDRFADHMELLRRSATPIPLSRVEDVLGGRTVPANAVAVTFDDGYADTLDSALPALQRHDVPATVFVAADAVLHGREFWWDELERIIHDSGRLPRRIELMLAGRTRAWDMPDTESDPASASETLVAQRQSIYESLWQAMRDSAATERETAMVTLRSLAGRDGVPRATHKPLDRDELGRLASDPLIEIGAHTASHPRLGGLPSVEQRREIDEGRRALETLIARRIARFAYPFGRATDYTDETMDLVRRAGFTCACINQAGRVDRSTDRFALPRLFVRDWDADGFAAALRVHGVRV